jgi:hypothetical protein
MARPPLGNVIVTLEQLRLIDGWVRRRYEHQELLKSETERDHVKSLMKKVEELTAALPEDQTGLEVTLKMSRKEARLIQRVANEVYARIATVVIPGYGERIDSEDSKRYGAYKAAA